MKTKIKKEKFKEGSRRAELFSRFFQVNFERNKKTATFLVKHPKITLWLMKKDPRVALVLAAMILFFYPEKINSDTKKTISRQALKSFFQILQEQKTRG
jgi:hypothetical protein